MLHARRAVMLARVLSIAVISVSCSYGSSARPDASTHDSHLFLDAPGQPIDGHPGDGHADAPTMFADASPACKAANILHGDGKHNPMMDCMSGCHDHGFSIAGTLVQADLVTPASNATVTIVDANNFSQDIIVSTNGNFFSFLPVTYPVRVTASLCPSTQIMTDHPISGACNATGCHEPAGVQGLIHL